MVHTQAAAASYGGLLEMQNLGPHLISLNQHLHFKQDSPGDSYTQKSLRTLAQRYPIAEFCRVDNCAKTSRGQSESTKTIAQDGIITHLYRGHLSSNLNH